MVAVEHEVLVDLVGHGDEVVLHAEPSDRLELRGGEHLAGGVVRRVQQHQPRAVGDERRERVDVGVVRGRVEGDRPQPSAGHRRDGGVAVVGGLEGEDLVAGVAQRQHRGGDRLRGSGGDQHLGGRVDVDPPEALLVIGDGDAQLLDARSRRVLVHSAADGRDGGVGHLDGSVLVGEALPEVDGSRGRGERRHLREDRRAEPRQAGRERRSAHRRSLARRPVR